ncbi:MAG: 16S rRNA (cytosine(1402)-N(4))-methyltransferase RsmH [Anaerolineae bacterium]|jgi:16S rRNA (cytosine1402-N4)-methyltransferase|nr:16S rRNA (cytosine(1402)-N(4))-methyltransferase RsmH [Anaerolineae bacterium]
MSDDHGAPRPHVPVLLREVLAALMPDGHAPERVIDGTAGAGGHSRALLDAGVGGLLAFDVDPTAIRLAGERLRPDLDSGRAHLVHDSYVHMADHLDALGWGDGVDAVLLDVGASSMHFDQPERGFSFLREGPLDMRFDPTSGRPPASDIVNHWSHAELADLLREYGEEPEAGRYARAILEARPLDTTTALAAVIKAASRPPRGRPITIHPATRTFQALRIAVNDELGTIERALPVALECLRAGGRLAVISFHSLEDRIVKHTFKDWAEDIKSPPGMVLPEKDARVRLVTKKPVEASPDEVTINPRARSAKLRVVEKL